MTLPALQAAKKDTEISLANENNPELLAIYKQELNEINAEIAALNIGSKTKRTTKKAKTPPAGGGEAKTPPAGGGEAKTPPAGGSEVANFSAEQTFFRKLLEAKGKQKTREEIATMLRGYNKAAIAQLVREKSPNAKLLQELAGHLAAIHKDLKAGESAEIALSAATVSKLNDFGKAQLQKMPSVALMLTFVGYQGKSPKKETVQKWLKDALKTPKTDKYFSEIQQAMQVLNLYLAGGTATVTLLAAQLRGLGNLGFLPQIANQNLLGKKTSPTQPFPEKGRAKESKTKGGAAKKSNTSGKYKSNLGCADTANSCNTNVSYKPYWDKKAATHDPQGQPYMMSSQELLATKYEVLPMSDYWKKIFGDLPAEGRFNIALCAKKGQGKTTLAMRFAKYFSDKVGSVLYLSNEQYGSAALKRQAEQNGITAADNITWCGCVDLLKELDLIKPNQYKLIIIDSTTDGQISKAMFESYLQKHNKTSFVAIIRKSQQGTDMGNDANFITGKVDVVVEFREEGNDKFAYWVKNRLANAQFLEDNEVQIEMPN